MRTPFRQGMLRLRLRHAAQTLADKGWPVIPGGYFNGERMAYDRPTCWATSCHPLLPDWETSTAFCDWWQDKPHSVLLPTGRVFDAIEVPALVGSAVRGVCGPTILTPNRNWIFLIRAGTPLMAELADRRDVVLHGLGSWVPAPPTVLPEGSVCWLLSPRQVGWVLPLAGAMQMALLSALVALDASFLDRPVDLRPLRLTTRPSPMAATLRRAS
jgi:hypothetical protein